MHKTENELISDEIDRQEHRHHRQLLGIFIAICLLCYVPRLFLPNEEEIFSLSEVKGVSDVWRLQVVGHLGIAALIASLLTLVEHSARRHLQRMIAFNAWRAALRNSMPKALADELVEILKEPTYRKDVRYHIVLTKYQGLPDEYLVVRRQINYTLINSTDKQQRIEVRSSTDAKYGVFPIQDRGRTVDVPRHIELSVDVRAEGLFLKRRVLRSLLKRIFSKDAGQEGRVVAKEVALLGSRDTAEVSTCAEEVVRVDEGKTVFFFSHPIEDLSVTISNECTDLVSFTGAELNARAKKEFIPEHSASYRYRGGLLPGQSFDISWKRN